MHPIRGKTSDRPSPCEGIVMREVEQDWVAYDPISDRVSLLNPTAAAVLELCNGSRTSGEIASEISKAFSIGTETALPDVLDIVEEFRAMHLVVLNEPKAD